MGADDGASLPRVGVRFLAEDRLARLLAEYQECRAAVLAQADDAERAAELLASLNAAFFLLMVARAEDLLREYLRDAGVSHMPNATMLPLLNLAIAHHRRTTRAKLRPELVDAVERLRALRNARAHGREATAVEPVERVKVTLARLFAALV